MSQFNLMPSTAGISVMAGPISDERSYRIIGAAIDVHRILGPGFLESVYQQAFALELGLRCIEFVREVAVPIYYKDTALPSPFRVDFICLGAVMVELKAKERLLGSDEAQLINYLKGARQTIGLLLNFGTARLEYRRLVNSAGLERQAASA
jgi:GxxExxY protein